MRARWWGGVGETPLPRPQSDASFDFTPEVPHTSRSPVARHHHLFPYLCGWACWLGPPALCHSESYDLGKLAATTTKALDRGSVQPSYRSLRLPRTGRPLRGLQAKPRVAAEDDRRSGIGGM